MPELLEIAGLAAAYRSGARKPSDVVREVYRRIAAYPQRPVWICLVPQEEALDRAAALEREDPASLPLYGIPFAVKDNIDVAGLPTTAGCPAYAYSPDEDATVVARLKKAGAILIGKTNLDQFATGLVGVRSPFGACGSVFDERYLSGGSSSGSAVAVARGLVSFSLGTDTAGSGRVPAAFNNLVGLKPSRGLISAHGVVPACRSLDCVSIFAPTVADSSAVLRVAEGFDARDPYSRARGRFAAPWVNGAFRFGVPSDDLLEFFGDTEAAGLYRKAIERCEAIGGTKVVFDYTPFRDVAALLYAGPWVAERLAAVREFASQHADAIHPVVRQIILGAEKYSAVDAFNGAYKLETLRKKAQTELARFDVMLLPTTGTIYTREAVEAEPIKLNSNLGYYTNFVNLMDMAGIAIPGGFRTNGLPFGVTVLAPAFSESALDTIAQRMQGTATAQPLPATVSVAVVGAHLTGQPLNSQLTERNARLIRTCRTAPGYKLYSLPNTTPPKPGLVRVPEFQGPGIEVEVWGVPETEFGSFVAMIPAPLGIGSVTLEDQSEVKCFICEPYAIQGAQDITQFGGWRKWLASR